MSSPKDSLDRVIASVPLNSTAARVTARGEHYEPDVTINSWHSDVPPPMRPIPEVSLSTCADLPGRKFGRFTVIGLVATENPNRKKAAWAVRCACGAYETRTAKAIRGGKDADDCCHRCRHFKRVKWRYQNLGARPLGDFINKGSES